MACEPSTLATEAACFTCLSGPQQQAIVVKLLCELLKAYDPDNAMATCDPSELAEAAACFSCLDPKVAAAITIKLLCEINDTLASPWLSWGIGDPTTDPGVHPALYVNEDDSTLWYWNLSTGTWQQIITI